MPSRAEPASAAVYRDLYSDTWVGVDALRRPIPTGANAPPRRDRFVGVFYFLTHGSEGYYKNPAQTSYNVNGDDPRALRDNSEIVRRVGGDPVTHPEGWKDPGTYWWGEPAVGYFLADDPWVARKNLQMLADAGVDVMIFDVTNGPTYTLALRNVLDVAERMRGEGLKTPQFAFITYSSTGPVANSLYDSIYAKNLYSNLWFEWHGKPLMLGDPGGSAPDKTPTRPEVRDFFAWRYSWANTKGPENDGHDEWEWADTGAPQMFGWHDNPRQAEEASVMVGGWSSSDLGRSYRGGDQPWGSRGAEPALNALENAPDVDRGDFFGQQWASALKIDPEFIWVTGWNEWTAGRQDNPGVPMLGQVTHPGQYYFVDEYNEEFSRDIMPMRGGHADNYYLQLIENVRRYKGARALPVQRGFQTMKLDELAGWNSVSPEYRDAVGDTEPRDWNGWGGRHYSNRSGRNDIVAAKVACDAANIYFFVRTAAPLTSWAQPRWMQLLIDAGSSPNTGWNGYDYLVNGKVVGAATTTLTRFKDGKTTLLRYRAKGNVLEVVVPRRLLGLTNLRRTTFDFHWVDNAPVGGDKNQIANWWYEGDSAPDGRFNYRYINTGVKAKATSLQ